MAKKKSGIDRAIEGLQADITVLEMAIARLRQQQAAAPKRKSKAVAEPPSIMGKLMQSVKEHQTA